VNSDQIRDAFLRFFEEKKHRIIPSSPLVPRGDPTLLLTTAGMVQIKPYFLGLAVPPSPRLASCQKCFRTTDIDSVGDAKHLTFFEMLGNFSVGDYFKKEAIAWAWEFVTERLKINPERLWVSVYLDDDESFNYWRGIGFPEKRIIRLGKEHNFWGPAGDSGPCGPCSEIHYDFGEQASCGKPDCGPGCDCGRFSEIWNLVFTQYNQDTNGKNTPLPKPNIDTGMGLERVAAVMQGVSSVYDTDLFIPLRDKICSITGVKHGKSTADDQAVRIIAEHSRGITFLIADGVLPSNEGRGYVLRRILRRACFFARKLGTEEPFLSDVTETIINKMGHVYPELIKNQSLIHEIVKAEEDKFTSTLGAGINLVEKAAHEAVRQGRNYIAGEEVFKFWDTYGFHPELTAEIAQDRGLTIDLEGFKAQMEEQKERARAGHKFSLKLSETIMLKDKAEIEVIPKPTSFVGYDKMKTRSKITRILDQKSGRSIKSASKGQKVAVVLEETPFYGEMGGQVGDTGKITADSSQIDVANTVWSPYGDLGEGAIIHLGQVVKGTISEGDIVEAKVDADHRLDIARNHTATHLLQAALRQVLGSRVQQRGSLVHPEGFRFDFSYLKATSKPQLNEIQHIVNEKIRANLPVKSNEVLYEEVKQAIDKGDVIALFDEKYGEKVRVLEIGKPPISAELCGGTHVKSTGEIGFFIITSESSIGTGLRRIEAVTGRGAEALIQERFEALETVAEQMRVSTAEVPKKITAFVAEFIAQLKLSASLESELARTIAESLLGKAENVNGITVLAAKVPSTSLPILREMGDWLRDRLKSTVIVLGTVHDGKPGFVAMVTPDLVNRGLHAGDIVKQVAAVTGGSGGGKADMAQAGGKDKSKLDEALELVKRLVQKVSQ
jgi:alanyl-tRNA synthetase